MLTSTKTKKQFRWLLLKLVPKKKEIITHIKYNLRYLVNRMAK